VGTVDSREVPLISGPLRPAWRRRLEATGKLTPALRAVVQHRELDGHADLGRSQPDARRGFHGGAHLSDEQL
jgi:hypothetical protein